VVGVKKELSVHPVHLRSPRAHLVSTVTTINWVTLQESVVKATTAVMERSSSIQWIKRTVISVRQDTSVNKDRKHRMRVARDILHAEKGTTTQLHANSVSLKFWCLIVWT